MPPMPIPPRPRTGRAIPLLVEGAKLSAAEFIRRYDAMPDLKKAELIEGIVYMTSAARYTVHGKQDGLMHGWAGGFALIQPGVQFAPNTTIHFTPDDICQPDAMLFRFKNDGGRVSIHPDGCLECAPELVIEIAASSLWIDVGKKKDLYRRCGVREYIVWRTEVNVLDWWTLENGDYVPLAASADGIHRSVIFPGLWMDSSALLAGNGLKVMAVLNDGMKH
jgi:hypothetical protein